MIRELRRQYDANVPADERGFRTLPMSIIAEAFGYTPNKSELWNDMLALKNETIAFNVLGKDGGTMQYGAGFISEWKVHSSRVEFKLPSFIEDVVRGLDAPKAIFQQLNWGIFNHFSGKYEAILYKLCRDYRGVGRTPYMDIPMFREYMGIEPHEYKEFRDLNRIVISGPVKTINESDVSDISIEVDFEKHGRKVIGLRFLITQRNQSVIELQELEENPAFRFAKVHIDQGTQQKYLQQRTPEQIALCIERANQYGEQQVKLGKAPNYGALYRTAIKDGWHVAAEEQAQKDNQVKKRQQEEQSVKAQQEQEQATRDAEVAQRVEDAFARFDVLAEETKDELREQFRATLTIVPLRKSFDKQGEKAPMIKHQFADFIHALGLPEPAKKKSKKTSK